MNLIKYPVFLIILFATISASAQRPGNDEGSRPDPIGIVKGKIEDKMTGEPLPYTNIILYSLRDTTLITGSMAAEDGRFMIEKVPFGRFYVEAKFIGYEKYKSGDIRITPQATLVDLGTLSINQVVNQLEEVQVTAERSPVEFKIDRKVVSITEILNSMGGSLARALENAPSITVDIDGNVMLRGSTNYQVLIDGKPSPLNGSDALQQIPASAVENVEIITNPSAKYDPDGLSGIINIITKKRALDGFSGLVNLSIGNRHKYRGDALLTYKNDKISIYGGGDFNDERNRGDLTKTQESYFTDTARTVHGEGTGERNRKGYTVKGGATYNLSKSSFFTLEGSFGNHGFGNNELTDFHQYTVPADTDIYYTNNSLQHRSEDFYGITANFEKSFNNPNHKLTSYLFYEKEWGGSEDVLDQIFTDENWQEMPVEQNNIKTTEDSKEKGLRFQTDYSRPLKETGKFETGYQMRLEKETEDYYLYNYNHANEIWEADPRYTNSMNFRQDIHSVYGTLSNRVLGFDYQAGIRAEYSYRNIQNIQSEVPSTLDLLDVFPTAHISRKIGKQDQALASYSRRINRPRGFFLDPFPQYMDQTTIRVGNPELRPEYVDSYEMSYQKGLGKSFISLEGYYRLTHNAMSRVTYVGDDGIRVFTMENLNKQHAGGAELMFNIQAAKWFNFNASTNVYLFRLVGNVADTDVATKSTNSDFRFNGNFRITPATRFQIQGFYQGPSVTAQGQRKEFFMTSASVRQDLLKQKLTATLQIRDIFKTGKFWFIAEGDNFHDEFRFSREAQVVMLTLSYKINNYKSRDRQRGDGEGPQNDDMIMNNQ